MSDAIFEVYRSDGTLQLDLSSSLPQTIGVIELGDYLESSNQFASAKINIPEWEGKRSWFSYEGYIIVTTIWCPTIYRTGNSIYFRVAYNSSSGNRPRIKYGVY